MRFDMVQPAHDPQRDEKLNFCVQWDVCDCSGLPLSNVHLLNTKSFVQIHLTSCFSEFSLLKVQVLNLA